MGRPRPDNAAAASRARREAVRRRRRARPAAGARRQDQQPDGGVQRPRQDHRPNHHLRGRDQRDGAVRHAAGHAAGLLLAPADRAPQTDAFTQVDEIDENKQVKRIFSGWMFADSPGLHGVEHPIYDVWLMDCRGGTTVIHETPRSTPRRPDTDNPDADGSTRPASPEVSPPPPQPKKRVKPKAPTVVAAPLPAARQCAARPRRLAEQRAPVDRAGPKARASGFRLKISAPCQPRRARREVSSVSGRPTLK